jgi:hypothetical protein
MPKEKEHLSGDVVLCVQGKDVEQFVLEHYLPKAVL